MHLVQRGETLYSIAQKAYGDGLEYPRILMANPWLDAESLRVGEIIRLPAVQSSQGNLLSVDPKGAGYEPAPEGPRPAPASAKASSGRSTFSFRDLVPSMGSSTLFGQPVHKISFFALAGLMVHAFVQGLLLWVVATLAFVREATLKKSLKATFHTEFVTLFTALVLGGVILLMIHIGTSAPGASSGQDLLQTVETYLSHPLGMTIAGLFILGLYLLLSMRFIPQSFGLHRAQTLILIFFGILLPHLMILYTFGQRYGLIKL